jgi:hypothetical protein
MLVTSANGVGLPGVPLVRRYRSHNGIVVGT